MNNNDSWLVADEQVEKCTECPYPDSCIRECIMENYIHKDEEDI